MCYTAPHTIVKHKFCLKYQNPGAWLIFQCTAPYSSKYDNCAIYSSTDYHVFNAHLKQATTRFGIFLRMLTSVNPQALQH